MRCPECNGSPWREITHEVVLPLAPGATNRRTLRLCYYHASGYEMSKGAEIRRLD